MFTKLVTQVTLMIFVDVIAQCTVLRCDQERGRCERTLRASLQQVLLASVNGTAEANGTGTIA